MIQVFIFLRYILKAIWIVPGVIDGSLFNRDAGANLLANGMELKHVGLCCFSGCAVCSCAPLTLGPDGPRAPSSGPYSQTAE